jgi:hypothetical protein
MSPARLFLVLSVILVVSLGVLAPSDARATVQRVVLVEEFGFFT